MASVNPLTQKYKKKVEVTDDRSTPEARAARVKRLRNLANLSRKEMCDSEELNVNTLKGWEIARYGGLPLDGAHKVVKRVAKEGIFCTVEWLLYEEGPPPKVNLTQTEAADNNTNTCSEQENIDKEIKLFHSNYANAVSHELIDDGMAPLYEKDDFVAGIKFLGKKIREAVGLNCLAQLANGDIQFRKLSQGKTADTYNLACLNANTTVDLPIIFDAELIWAAPVIWHRKKTLLLKENEHEQNK